MGAAGKCEWEEFGAEGQELTDEQSEGWEGSSPPGRTQSLWKPNPLTSF